MKKVKMMGFKGEHWVSIKRMERFVKKVKRRGLRA
jgi:hypothetical protein